ncbi:MAG: hypothetical protein EOP86_15155 [Verrucomicrobiaceae bacterium]|nr:MAG: hypothetical protein EOP86_15155 [Verrucomicrobiaceae bacterium]
MPSNTVVYQVPGAITDLSIPPLPRDALLTAANSGIRFLFDLANAYSWTPGTPVQGKAVKDLSEISADGLINTAGTLAAAGNGIDFTTSTGRACLSAPASVLADLYADQEYVLCGYWKLPVLGNFPGVGGGQNTTLLTAESGASDHYGNSAEIVMAAWDMGAAGRLRLTRPVAVSTSGVESITLDLTPHAGLLTQIAVWRTAAAWNCRLKSSAGTTLGIPNTVNVKSTGDFSSKALHWGMSGSFGVQVNNSARTGLRLYRGFAENTKRSGRTAITVLDEDYGRTVGRAVYG